MTKLFDDVKVIDADTHYTEPPDLWTSRAPAAYKDRVLHVEERNDLPTWVIDDVEFGFARGGGPHPTCLYPSPLDTVADAMGTLRPDTRRKAMGENAAKLYRL